MARKLISKKTKKRVQQLLGIKPAKAEPVAKANPIPLQQLGYRAALDRCDAGIIAGWACKLGDNTPLEIEAWVGDTKIAEGRADGFRPDLLEAGLNDGRHAFWLVVVEDANLASDAATISLRDKVTAQELPAGQLNATSASVKGRVNTTANGKLKITLNDEVPINTPLVIYRDHLLVQEARLPKPNQDGSFTVELPYWMVDIGKMNLRLGFAGHIQPLASLEIENSSDQSRSFFAELTENKPLGQHCFSLHEQYRRTSTTSDKTQFEQLAILHSVLTHPVPMTDMDCQAYEKLSFRLPKTDTPQVSIIIPAYAKSALTYRTIASIALAPTDISFEIIVADDCSPDDTSALPELIENLRLVRTIENLRFLRNCNHAAAHARGQFLLFLNNDTEVCAYWLDALLAPFEDPHVGATGGKLLDMDGHLQDAGGIVWQNGSAWNVGRGAPADMPEYNYIRETDYVSGAMLCTRRDLWQQLGGFSDDLAPCYYEDTDYCFKVRAAGRKTIYTPFATAFHMEGASHGTDVSSGLKRYQAINKDTFKAKWQADLRPQLADGRAEERLAQDRGITGRVLMVDDQVPNPSSSAGAYAALEEMKLIQTLGYKVTFIAKHFSTRSKYVQTMQKLGAEVIYAPYVDDYRDYITRHISLFDAVYITRYKIAADVLPVLADTGDIPVLFNNADLHFLREIRSAELTPDDTAKMDSALETKSQELAICRAVSRVLCYTAAEKAVLVENDIPAEKISITPWVLPRREPGPEFGMRHGIAFLGGFNHFPNGEAVDYLISDLMPALGKKRPDIKLYIYGSNMPTFEGLADNIEAIGFVENLHAVFHDHRLFVAPLLSGAGIKGKVLDAISYGTPTILSPIAAEGVGLADGDNTLITDNTDAWVEAVIQAYDDATLWQKLRDNALYLARTAYSRDSGIQRMREIFKATV